MASSEPVIAGQQSHAVGELGIALISASLLLALFLLIPVEPKKVESAPIITVTTVASSTAPDAFADLPLVAQAAVVYDLATKEVLFEKNADAQLPLASLTKLLTVYAALSELSPDTPVTISSGAAQAEAPRAFSAGQTFALGDLARLTLTASLNDGATAIAEATALRENRSTYETLSSAAATLDLAQTYAVNGSGLDVSTTVSGGYGSAYDLARLAGALSAIAPAIAAATTESSAHAVSAGGTSFTVKNTDPIIASMPGLLLSKTGFTDLAGGNLVLVFDSGLEHPIAIVVLGSSEKARFTDGAALVFATLAHFAGITSL